MPTSPRCLSCTIPSHLGSSAPAGIELQTLSAELVLPPQWPWFQKRGRAQQMTSSKVVRTAGVLRDIGR
eukprot:4612512-Lingulodinium_polyedra.AAC.1